MTAQKQCLLPAASVWEERKPSSGLPHDVGCVLGVGVGTVFVG